MLRVKRRPMLLVWMGVGVLCGFPQVLLAQAADPPQKEYFSAICPLEPALEVSPYGEYWFEGTIGKTQVRLYLQRGGEAVSGAFYDVADWIPQILRGRWTGDGAIEATATAREDAKTGRLKGRASAAGFTGLWTPIHGEDQAIELHPSSEHSCDGKGPWRAFRDARWPITFSYPASWRLEATENDVTLTCPDPSLMVYDDFNIRISRRAAPDDEPEFFVSCGEKWLTGQFCDCADRSRCKEAEIVRHGPITTLRSDDEGRRIYCRGGGYIALGYGMSAAAWYDRRWFEWTGSGPASELMARILDTVRPRP